MWRPGHPRPPVKAVAAFIGQLSTSHFSFKQYTVEGTQTVLWAALLDTPKRISLLFGLHSGSENRAQLFIS